ncbi:MAG TPA: hypothetical protein VJ723_01065 [Candidatus Angelobacter sp.]|nr:hypothetical protein [Candidatus Angelobacter sp.]
MTARTILRVAVALLAFARIAHSFQQPAVAAQKGLTGAKSSVQTVNVPDLTWFSSQTQVDRALQPLRLKGVVVQDGKWPPLAVVMSQSPAPGSQFSPGGQVTYTVGNPQASLSVDKSQTNFALTLKPRPRADREFMATVPAPRYQFLWDKEPGPELPAPYASHSFGKPGEHLVSAIAHVMGRDLASNTLTITIAPNVPPAPVPDYVVTLQPETTRLESGRREFFSASLEPNPPTRSKVEYCFEWADKTPDVCDRGAAAPHIYSIRGTYQPLVYVRVNGGPPIYSERVAVTVGLPQGTIIALIVGGILGALVGGLSAHKISKLLRPRITPHAGTADLRIANPGSLTKGPAVRIGCVCPPPAVTLIAPGPVVKKKKEASHA